MKINGSDLPIEIDGGDATQVVLVIKNLAGESLFEVKGDGSVKVDNVGLLGNVAPQEVDDAANAAAIVTALKAMGLFIDPP